MKVIIGAIAIMAISASAHGGGRDASSGVRQVQRNGLNDMLEQATLSDSALFVRFYMNG